MSVYVIAAKGSRQAISFTSASGCSGSICMFSFFGRATPCPPSLPMPPAEAASAAGTSAGSDEVALRTIKTDYHVCDQAEANQQREKEEKDLHSEGSEAMAAFKKLVAGPTKVKPRSQLSKASGSRMESRAVTESDATEVAPSVSPPPSVCPQEAEDELPPLLPAGSVTQTLAEVDTVPDAGAPANVVYTRAIHRMIMHREEMMADIGAQQQAVQAAPVPHAPVEAHVMWDRDAEGDMGNAANAGHIENAGSNGSVADWHSLPTTSSRVTHPDPEYVFTYPYGWYSGGSGYQALAVAPAVVTYNKMKDMLAIVKEITNAVVVRGPTDPGAGREMKYYEAIIKGSDVGALTIGMTTKRTRSGDEWIARHPTRLYVKGLGTDYIHSMKTAEMMNALRAFVRT